MPLDDKPPIHFKQVIREYVYTAKKVSQNTTLKIVTLTEHLKVFYLHTPSVPDFNTIMICEHDAFKIHIVLSLEHLVYANRILSDVR